MLARVSHIESFRRWKNWTPLHDEDVEPSLDEFVASIMSDQPSEAMQVGTAFHKAIENASDGDHFEFSASGYTFMLRGGEVTLPEIREMRAFGQYGALTVTGQVDAIQGRIVTDHKTTKRFDAERYLDGVQWKFYLDLFGADVFRWVIFQIKEMGERTYDVSPPQELVAYRYPDLHADCERWAAEYLAFALEHLPGSIPEDSRELAELLRA